MKIITARFPGYCARTGARILPGDRIEHHGRGRQVLLTRAAASSTPAVDTYQFGGRTFYRNVNGRCEDAPCCGCCTI